MFAYSFTRTGTSLIFPKKTPSHSERKVGADMSAVQDLWCRLKYRADVDMMDVLSFDNTRRSVYSSIYQNECANLFTDM